MFRAVNPCLFLLPNHGRRSHPLITLVPGHACRKVNKFHQGCPWRPGFAHCVLPSLPHPPQPGPHWVGGRGPGRLWSVQGSAVSSPPSPVGCAREALLCPRLCPTCKQLAKDWGQPCQRGVPGPPMRAERGGKQCLPPAPRLHACSRGMGGGSQAPSVQ